MNVEKINKLNTALTKYFSFSYEITDFDNPDYLIDEFELNLDFGIPDFDEQVLNKVLNKMIFS